jgi:hypothetical protein
MNDPPLAGKEDSMVRKLFAAAALVFGLGVAAMPAPAIDFICSCDLCRTRPNLACRDLDSGHAGFTSCSAYYASHC